MKNTQVPPGFSDLLSFGLTDALCGRRSRRVCLGAHIPDGVFAYTSPHEPFPLSEFETMLVVSACGGVTAWNNLIYRADRYAPHLSNYAGSAGGRTFPSAAGFHTSTLFFTDDTGIYKLDTRDAAPDTEPDSASHLDPNRLAGQVKQRCTKISGTRIDIPASIPYTEPHNTWIVNKLGSLLIIPVGDLAQHALLNLCYMLQNNLVVYDDINKRAVPGIEQFSGIVDTDNVWPLTFVDQWSLAEVTAELSTSCYAGTLMLQAMGLGGWMFNGIDPFTVLGAGAPDVTGLGFRFDTDDRWPYPNVTGKNGVLEAFCPPHYADMRAAVEAVCERKFGKGGPFHPDTPGPWKDSRTVRSAAQVHDDQFKDCVTLQAQYLFDTFGKFPATVPSLFVITYLQAHHLDLDFYDTFYKPGAYLQTHKRHMERWHPDRITTPE